MSGMQKTDEDTLSKCPILIVKTFRKMNLITSLLKKNKLQEINLNQLKLKEHDSYKKVKKITTNFESVDDEDARNEKLLDEKLS